jgi:hypothetical protein
MTDTPESPVSRLWHTIWLGEPSDMLDDVLADPYVRHTRDGTVSVSVRQYRDHMRQATRNVRGTSLSIDQLVETGDRAFARITLEGVNVASGDPVTITVAGEYRVSDGLIVESWSMHQPGLDWR